MDCTGWSGALQGLRQQASVFTRVKVASHEAAPVSRTELDGAYDQIRDSVDLVADHPQDGCYARAEVLCHELQRRGLESKKVFVTPLIRELRTAEMPRGQGWRYHVATVAMTTDAGAQVLDPLLSQDPLPVEEWFAAIWQGGPGTVSIHEPTKYLNGLTFSCDSRRHEQDARQTLSNLRQLHPKGSR